MRVKTSRVTCSLFQFEYLCTLAIALSLLTERTKGDGDDDVVVRGETREETEERN